MVPPEFGPVLLKLAHNDLGHNGSARTYMILRRNYYWKGMKAFVMNYIKTCDLCRQHNATATRYVKGYVLNQPTITFLLEEYTVFYKEKIPQHLLFNWQHYCVNNNKNSMYLVVHVINVILHKL